MSQTRINLSKSVQRKLASRQIIPHPEPIILPTRDNQAEINSYHITNQLPKQKSLAYQERIKILEREIEDYQFEHEANIVYNKQFRQLGKLLGDQDMQFQEIRQYIQDIILSPTNTTQKDQSNFFYNKNKTQNSALFNQYWQKCSQTNWAELSQQLLYSDEEQFYRIVSIFAIKQYTQFAMEPVKIQNFNQISANRFNFVKNWQDSIQNTLIQSKNKTNAKYENEVFQKNREIELLRADNNKINNDLQQQWKQMQNIQSLIKSQKSKLIQEIQISQQQLSKQKEHIQYLEQENRQYQSFHKKKLQQIDKQNQLHTQSLISENLQLKNKYQRQINELINQLDQLNHQNQQLRQTYESEKRQSHIIKIQLQQNRNKLKETEARVLDLFKALDEQKYKNSKLDEELNTSKQKFMNHSQVSQNGEDKKMELLHEITQLQKKLNKLEEQLEERQLVINDKNEEITIIRSQNQRLEDEMIILAQQCERLRDLEYKDSTNSNKLSDELSDNKVSMQVDDKAEELEQKIRIKDYEIRTKLQVVNDLQERNNINREKIIALEKEVDQLRKKIKQLEYSLNNAQIQIKQTQQIKVRQVNQTQYNYRIQIQKFNQNLQNSINKINNLEKEMLFMTEEKEILAKQNLSLVSRNKAYQNQWNQQKQEWQLKQKQHNTIIQKYEYRIRDLQQNISELTQKLQEFKQISKVEENKYFMELQSKNQVHKINQKQICQLKTVIHQKQQEIKKIAEEKYSSQTQIQKMFKIITQLEQKIKVLSKQISYLKEEKLNYSQSEDFIKEMDLVLKKKSDDISHLEQQIASIKKRYELMIANNEQLYQELQKIQKVTTNLKSQNFNLSEENSKLLAQHSHLLSSVKHLTLQLDRLSSENLELSEQLFVYSQTDTRKIGHRRNQSSNMSIMKGNHINLKPIYEAPNSTIQIENQPSKQPFHQTNLSSICKRDSNSTQLKMESNEGFSSRMQNTNTFEGYNYQIKSAFEENRQTKDVQQDEDKYKTSESENTKKQKQQSIQDKKSELSLEQNGSKNSEQPEIYHRNVDQSSLREQFQTQDKLISQKNSSQKFISQQRINFQIQADNIYRTDNFLRPKKESQKQYQESKSIKNEPSNASLDQQEHPSEIESKKQFEQNNHLLSAVSMPFSHHRINSEDFSPSGYQGDKFSRQGIIVNQGISQNTITKKSSQQNLFNKSVIKDSQRYPSPQNVVKIERLSKNLMTHNFHSQKQSTFSEPKFLSSHKNYLTPSMTINNSQPSIMHTSNSPSDRDVNRNPSTSKLVSIRTIEGRIQKSPPKLSQHNQSSSRILSHIRSESSLHKTQSNYLVQERPQNQLLQTFNPQNNVYSQRTFKQQTRSRQKISQNSISSLSKNQQSIRGQSNQSREKIQFNKIQKNSQIHASAASCWANSPHKKLQQISKKSQIISPTNRNNIISPTNNAQKINRNVYTYNRATSPANIQPYRYTSKPNLLRIQQNLNSRPNSDYYSRQNAGKPSDYHSSKIQQQRQIYSSKYKKVEGMSESNDSGIDVAQRDTLLNCCNDC